MKPGLTAAEIRSLPATIDLVTAGRIFGIGRTTAYHLARTGEFPCRVLRIGRTYRVSTAAVLAALGLSADDGAGLSGEPARGGQPAPQEND
ncbi:helix-turn-helix domain-containing protein [Actinomadura sp. LOL_016]|uniref:helix-turn-helix domain-containing protein n=1 Tax=Actinomadura sp. LOL_016 TaxID=3345411 RepID=UPI003A89F4C5